MDDHEFAQIARDILESIGGLVATDKDGVVTFASKGWCRYMGLKSENVVGRPLKEIVPGNTVDNLLGRKKSGALSQPVNYFVPKSDGIRRRLIVYRDGVASDENFAGAVTFDILTSHDGKYARAKTVDALESLFLKDKMYQENLSALQNVDRLSEEILGTSPAVRALKALVARVASSNVSVCILGETGTGKELVADSIHKLSKRATKPFVKINCAAIPKELIESELFGYEPGAFTGASRSGKQGKFEAANGGTLLLDEIGELSMNLQAKLLRVLQSREVERVGGTTSIPIDVRLICSTNRNLHQMVQRGEFRADLYYRINTMEINVPPLREREDDIPALVANFIRNSNEFNDLSVSGISNPALALLSSHDWPGNVRELENAVQRACVLCGTGTLQVSHFGGLSSSSAISPNYSSAATPSPEPAPYSAPAPAPFRSSFAEREKQSILYALDDCGGNRTAAARKLGFSRSTLYAKLRKYEIE